jgi:hypothetical protein
MDLKIAESLYLNLELLISDLNSVSSTIQLFSCKGCGCNSVLIDASDARGEGDGEGSGEGFGEGCTGLRLVAVAIVGLGVGVGVDVDSIPVIS